MSDTAVYRDFDPGIFTKERTAVIDGDSFAYAIGWNHQNDFFEQKCRKEVDDTIHDILQGTRSQHYVGILSPASGDGEEILPNFRYAIARDTPYKGNREEKPEWYQAWCPVIEDQLITKWGFVRAPQGFEADDLVITMCNVIKVAGGIPICCGNDKDLRQQPGQHFNLRTKVLDVLTAEEASLNLWKQVLMGDSTDNIPGIKGMGKVKAEKLLLGSEEPYEHIAFQAYMDACKSVDAGIQYFYENYMLVKLRTDVSLESIEEEMIHGYNLDEFANYNSILPEEPDEDIPDFSR